MKSLNLDKRYGGLGVLLSSLRSRQSCGIGEYPDLVLMGEFCRKCDFEILQILPLNDTGPEASPYGAHGAFALHPVYLRLQNLTNDADDLDRIERLRSRTHEEDISFSEIYLSKINLLRKIYYRFFGSAEKTVPDFKRLDISPRIKEFCAYSYLKEIYNNAPWYEWGAKHQGGGEKLVESLWQEAPMRLYFYAWVHQEASKQLLDAAGKLEEMGVYLKGDIPILMNKDSADVWANRRYFDLDFTAGAPPDMFSQSGQNWGFPVYNGRELKASDYDWWAERMKESSRYYHAIRLDHVIGFLRIWKIPVYDKSAASGRYEPAAKFSSAEWLDAGFSADELYLLSSCVELQVNLLKTGIALERFLPWMKPSRVEGFYRLHRDFFSEQKLFAPGVPDEIREVLLGLYHRRALIETQEGYVPSWFYESSPAFLSLDDHKKEIFRNMVSHYYHESEELWKKEGRSFLGALHHSSDALLCGEDLGDVPKSTGALLEESDICSLKVLRWSRKYDEPGVPFYRQEEYPFLSVITTSVHDSSTLRGWWEEDTEGARILLEMLSSQKNDFMLNKKDGAEESEKNILQERSLLPQTAREILRWVMGVNSAIAILPIQDFLAASGEYLRVSPSRERINVPGTVSETNWSYAVPAFLEELLEDQNLFALGKELNSLRPPGVLPLKPR